MNVSPEFNVRSPFDKVYLISCRTHTVTYIRIDVVESKTIEFIS